MPCVFPGVMFFCSFSKRVSPNLDKSLQDAALRPAVQTSRRHAGREMARTEELKKSLSEALDKNKQRNTFEIFVQTFRFNMEFIWFHFWRISHWNQNVQRKIVQGRLLKQGRLSLAPSGPPCLGASAPCSSLACQNHVKSTCHINPYHNILIY